LSRYVDWSGRCKTPAGVRDRGDPTGALAPRRLPGPPAESEAPGAPINKLELLKCKRGEKRAWISKRLEIYPKKPNKRKSYL
jgi:hypothetical protein